MKVLLVNGSSRKKGCTNAALCEVERALQEAGIGTEQFFIGNEALPDCIACRKCRETGRCVFHDSVNEFVEKAKSADGFVFGSPVYFAHPSGRLLAFMERHFSLNPRRQYFLPGGREPQLLSTLSISILPSALCR